MRLLFRPWSNEGVVFHTAIYDALLYFLAIAFLMSALSNGYLIIQLVNASIGHYPADKS